MHRTLFLQQELRKLQHANPRAVVLDVGNLEKQGALHKKLMQEFPGFEWHGLDILDQKSVGLHFEHQTIGSFEVMPFPDESFDAIYIGEVIEHTWEPKKVLDRCNAILKKGGVLILDTPNVYSLSRMLRYLLTGRDIVAGNPEHKIFFSAAMLELLFAQSNFHIHTMASEMNFVTRKAKFPLPAVGPFKMMGECLLVSARKK